jgi:hypothetical protein
MKFYITQEGKKFLTERKKSKKSAKDTEDDSREDKEDTAEHGMILQKLIKKG